MNEKRTKNADPRELTEDFRGSPKQIKVGRRPPAFSSRLI